jgi:hypothetical protein
MYGGFFFSLSAAFPRQPEHVSVYEKVTCVAGPTVAGPTVVDKLLT